MLDRLKPLHGAIFPRRRIRTTKVSIVSSSTTVVQTLAATKAGRGHGTWSQSHWKFFVEIRSIATLKTFDSCRLSARSAFLQWVGQNPSLPSVIQGAEEARRNFLDSLPSGQSAATPVCPHGPKCPRKAVMESAAARKERLKALKSQAEASNGTDSQAVAEPQLKFRNYQPTSKKIVHEVVAPAAPPAYQEPVAPPDSTAANGQVRSAQVQATVWHSKSQTPC